MVFCEEFVWTCLIVHGKFSFIVRLIKKKLKKNKPILHRISRFFENYKTFLKTFDNSINSILPFHIIIIKNKWTVTQVPNNNYYFGHKS